MRNALVSAIASVKRGAAYQKFRKLRGSARMALVVLVARYKRQRSRATFIAVTGSSAKSTTVALLAHILSGPRTVKAQVHRNSLGDVCRAIGTVTRRDELVVLEIGTGAPGEIERMAAVVRPNIGIVTLVNVEHYSAFRSTEAIAAEKGSLIKALPQDGLALLNNDDALVLSMSKLTDARVVSFGSCGADYAWGKVNSDTPGNLTFALTHRDRELSLKTRLTGNHNCLAVTAAAACALELGLSESIVTERVGSYEPLFGRLSVHKFDAGPTFILDTVKAPYYSLLLALSVLKDSVAPRKRFVLGMISDYAGNPKAKYRDTYRAAAAVADQVLFVGDAVKKYQPPSEDVALGRFVSFERVEDLAKYIRESAISGEIILVKGSGNLHLERLMLDWRADVKCWPNVCGKTGVACPECGLYGAPFSQHGVGRFVQSEAEKLRGSVEGNGGAR